MSNPRYVYTIALNKAESDAVQTLRDAGVKIVDIFRRGLVAYNPVPKQKVDMPDIAGL